MPSSAYPRIYTIQIKLLKTGITDTDDDLEAYDDFAALLAGSANNNDCDFTNYGSGKTLTDTEVSTPPTTDDTANTQWSQLPDQTWTAAGGTTNNTTAKLVVCYDPLGTNVNSNLIPLTHHDFVATTDGNDLIADFAQVSPGFFSAS